MVLSYPSTILEQIKDRFPFLHYVILIHIVLLAFTLTFIFIDNRVLMGINIWLKPTKFIISAIIVLWTMAWYLINYPFKPMTKNGLAIAASIFMLIENIAISMQAWRGVTSHYNSNTVFDAMVFKMMGLAIGLFTIIVFWLFIKSFSSKLEFSGVMRWSFRIGWFAFLFASVVGGAMISQRGYAIGVEDGGRGIPFLNWSTKGGDLRIAHFLGLHAIQVVPLVTYFISKQIRDKSRMTVLSISFALLYLGCIFFTFYQAKAGQPLF